MRKTKIATSPPVFADKEEPLEYIPSEKEILAVQTLEGIRSVLENGRLSNEDCCSRIENLIHLYYRELEININRHNELE